MGSLTSCMRKAGKALSEDDRQFLTAAMAEYERQGVPTAEAAQRAIVDLIGQEQETVRGWLDAVRADGVEVPAQFEAMLAPAEVVPQAVAPEPVPEPATPEPVAAEPEPEPVAAPEPVVEPEQPPQEDRNNFTLQRLNRDTNEMEPVTFTRGEYVEVALIGSDKRDFGDIDGISQARREFSVNGLWHPFGAAYKANRPEPAKKDTVPMSQVVDAVNKKFGAGLGPADAVSLLDAFKGTVRAMYDGTATLDDYKAAYRRVRNADAAKAELGGLTKDDLIRTFGIMARPGEKKDSLIESAYKSMLRAFALGKQYGPTGYLMTRGGLENFERQKAEALDAIVDGHTAEDLAAFAAEVKAEREAEAAKRAAAFESIKNPKTLDEYRRFMSFHTRDGKTTTEVRMSMLTPEQRAEFDLMLAEESRGRRKATTEEQRTQVRVAGQTVDGNIIATRHTKKGHDLFVVRLAERVSREDYETLNAGAKKIGGYYSSFRGGGAIPGFQFTTRDQAEAFVKLAGGDATAAREAAQERRDAYADDRSQTAAERLTEMADRMQAEAEESLSRERKANTQRRVRFAAAAEDAARQAKAMAKTMRNVAEALTNGTAKFLDRVRTKTQVQLLQTYVANAKSEELRAKYPSYTEQEKRRGQPPTMETADYAEFPTFTAFRSDLASLGRQLQEVDGTKKLGDQLMRVADDVTDAFTAWVKEPGNFFRVATFSGRGTGERAMFSNKAETERAIARSGYRGKAIPWSVKRGEWTVIMSPSEAMSRGLWTGDGDKRITLNAEFGAELVEKMGRASRRGAKVSVPWQFERAYERRKQLEKMGLETPAEFRAALREFIGLREQAEEADRIKALERAMVGRAKDGYDFFPTPESVADEMIAAADIQPGMAVLEPSAGMGHIADRIRAAGAEPEVVEIDNARRELLREKGYYVQPYEDFLNMEPRKFFTWGDVMRAPDGTEGIMHGGRGWSGRASLHAINEDGTEGRMLGWYDRDDLVGVRHRGFRGNDSGGYDRIVMNPPFSEGRDIEHVRHAYTLLKPGGRLVALMGESAFTNQNARAKEFRSWLESVGGTDEKLPPGSFMDPSLPVNTGANARMVVIEKPGAESTELYAMADGGPAPRRMTLADITQVRRSAQAVSREFGVAVTVVPNQGDASVPERIRGQNMTAQGMMTTGPEGEAVWLFTDTLGSVQRAEQILAHEFIGHIGVERIMRAEDWSGVVDTVRGVLDGSIPVTDDVGPADRQASLGAIQRPAAVSREVADAIRSARERYPTADDVMLAREAVAVMAERGIEGGFVQRILAALRRALRRAFPSLAWSDAELRDLLRRSAIALRQRMQRGDQRLDALSDGDIFDDFDPNNPAPTIARVLRNLEEGPEDGSLYTDDDAITDLDAIARDSEDVPGMAELRNAIERVREEEDAYSAAKGRDIGNDLDAAREAVIAAARTIADAGGADAMFANPGPSDVDQTRTPEFRRWFGDSKVVDANGEPLVVYHGTPEVNRIAPRKVSPSKQKREARDKAIQRLSEIASERGIPDWSSVANVLERLVQYGMAAERGVTPEMAAEARRLMDVVYAGQARWTSGREELAFNVFSMPSDGNELGAHFGTKRQASAFGNAFPFYLSIKNPVRLPDLGTWNYQSVIRELRKRGVNISDSEYDVVFSAADNNEALRKLLVSKGIDGVVYENEAEGKGDSYIAFRPEQIKSAIGNRGTFDPNDPNILFANPDLRTPEGANRVLGAIRDAIKRRDETPVPVAQRMQDLLARARAGLYWTMTRQQVVDVIADVLPQARQFEEAARRMDADFNELSQEGFAVAEQWASLFSAVGRQNGRLRVGVRSRADEAAALASVMHDATLEGYEPDPEANTAQPTTLQERALRQRFETLADDVKAIYRSARDAYATRRRKFLAALIERINAAEVSNEQKAKMVAAIRLQFESAQVKGPYFPLARFGEYWVSGTDPAGVRDRQFVMAETPADQRQAIDRLRAAGYTVKHGKSVRDLVRDNGIGGGAVTQLIEMIDKADVGDADAAQLKDDIYQLYLQTLPDVSVRKQFIHRKGTPGFSNDALRAFSSHMSRSSRQLSRLRWGHVLARHLREMREAAPDTADPNKAADGVNALQSSYQWMMQPTLSTAAARLTSLGFFWYLGITPAAAIINTSQQAMVTYPWMAARYGDAPAASAMAKANADYLAAAVPGKVGKAKRAAMEAEFDGGLGRALDDLESSGAIDRTQTMSLAGLSEDSGEMALWARRAMQVVSWVYHQTERLNREATAVAAYRLARGSGKSHDDSVREAYAAIFDTHFDYSLGNRAPWMRPPAARVFFLFKQYAQNMTYQMVRQTYNALAGADQQARTLARRQLARMLGMTFLLGGAYAMPGMIGFGVSHLFYAATVVMNALGDDDDEPIDVELEFRSWLADTFTPTGGELIAKGAVNALTPADLASRVSLGELWLRAPDRDLEGRNLYANLIEQALGPVVGIGASLASAASTYSQGEPLRAMEQASPKFIRDILRTYRYSEEGARTFQGYPIIDEFERSELLLQAMGFSPSRLATLQAQNAAFKRLEQRTLDRRTRIMQDIYDAQRKSDPVAEGEAFKRLHRWNEQVDPSLAIRWQDLLASMRSRERAAVEGEGGVIINDRVQPMLEERRFAPER